jgi:chaperonin GroES
MMKFRIHPLYDRVVVKPTDDEGMTESGLFIPEVARQNKLLGRGEVQAVGTGRVTLEGKVCPLVVKPGDLVIYDRKAAMPIPWGETEAVLLREPEIFGTVEQLEVPDAPRIIVPDGILAGSAS